ncbi:MAG TPA: hypothetical protein VGA99_13130 [bacterium]
MKLRHRFAAKDTLTRQESESALKTFVQDGLASQAMTKLTEGAFFVALALQLGASNLIIGLLAAIPPLVRLIQLPSIYLIVEVRREMRNLSTVEGLRQMVQFPFGIIKSEQQRVK